MLFATAELGRSKFRFGLLTLGAGLLVFVLLFQQALLDAVLDGMAGAVKLQTGSVIVMSRTAKRTFGAGYINADELTRVGQLQGVDNVGKLGVGFMSYRPPSNNERVNVSVIGYQRGKPGTPTAVRSGRLPEKSDEVVASAEGAAGRFGIGDSLTFEPGDATLQVVGLTEGSLLSVSPAIWIPWESYERLARDAVPALKEVLPSALAVQPSVGTSASRVIQDINTGMPGLDAQTRDEAAESAPGRAPIQAAFLTVMLLCYIVVSVVIGFFFLTMTLQKEASITLLRAVGANARYLISCLLLEVVLVTTGGLVVGVIVLYLVKSTMKSVIIDPDPAGIVATVIPALAVALLGAVPPMRRVLRADPSAVVSRPTLGGMG